MKHSRDIRNSSCPLLAVRQLMAHFWPVTSNTSLNNSQEDPAVSISHSSLSAGSLDAATLC